MEPMRQLSCAIMPPCAQLIWLFSQHVLNRGGLGVKSPIDRI
jgi:hypothetical protein